MMCWTFGDYGDMEIDVEDSFNLRPDLTSTIHESDLTDSTAESQNPRYFEEMA